MLNLAGDQDADRVIEKELARSRIHVVRHNERLQGEVPTKLSGILTKEDQEVFWFRRAWYYWMVTGPVPLNVAQELYQDPVGREDVRVAGHCGCPPPEDWASHYDAQNRPLLSLSRKAVLEKSAGLHSVQEVLKTVNFAENPAQEAAYSVVDTYHIDSEVGLRLFVDTLRAHDVID